MKKEIFSAILSAAIIVGATAPVINALDKSEPSAILVTPPAPKITDAERQAELGRRRAEVFKRMKPNSVFVLWSAEPRNYAGDVDFFYRQENSLYYLTNLRQTGATLILRKKADGSTQETLFLPQRNPQFETWNGRMYSNEDATKISGVKEIIGTAALPAVLQILRDKKAGSAPGAEPAISDAENVYLLLPFTDRDADGRVEFTREAEFAKNLTAYKVENARPIVDDMRLYKSPYEIKLMQHAIDITTEAQMRSMGMVGKAKYEYEVQAEVEYTFRRRNADYWGYPSIVGCGPNATTLHYVESQGEVKPGDLMLMDVGAEYDHYTADVTRTYPVSGKFTKEQAEIYQIVYDAQEAAAKAAKPGATMGQVGEAAANVIKDGLFRLGLITDKNSDQYRIWYMHGLGHWLGMNVHDVGSYGRPMQAGVVFTNEPGIYVREDALNYFPKTPEWAAFIEKVRPAFEKYKNIGVRIEDDLLVTPNGVEWLTKKLPRSLADVEAFMARASKEMRTAKLPTTKSDLFLQTLGGGDVSPAGNLTSFNLVQGQTVRRGWIQTGKQTAQAGENHAAHSE